MQKSDLIIIAARPGMGKSALALNIAFNAARRAHDAKREAAPPKTAPSLRSSASKCRARSSRNAFFPPNPRVPADKVRRGDIEPHEYDDIADTLALLQDLPLYIDETGALRLPRCRRARGVSSAPKGLAFS